MNLADIRKKAQMEKRGESSSVPPVVPVAPATPSPVEADEFLALFPEEAPEHPAPPAPVPEEAPERAPLLVERPQQQQVEVASFCIGDTSFDPITQILAGREGSCGDEEEILADSSLVADGETIFQEFLCFRVSDEKYAINIMQIKEIIKPREVTEVPRVPQFVSGILSLRGIIIPVFNMRRRLGLPVVQESAKERIIVIRKDEEFCGILVDEVIQVVRIAAHSIEPPPAVLDAVDRDFVNGIGRYDGMMLILLNLEKILDINVC